MSRKKPTPSHTKDTNEVESDEGEDEEEDEEEGKVAEREEAEQEVNESEPMDTSKIPEAVHTHNGHVSSVEGDCSDTSVDGLQNGKSPPEIPNGDNGEVKPVEDTGDQRLEPAAEEDAGMSCHNLGVCFYRKIINDRMV